MERNRLRSHRLVVQPCVRLRTAGDGTVPGSHRCAEGIHDRDRHVERGGDGARASLALRRDSPLLARSSDWVRQGTSRAHSRRWRRGSRRRSARSRLDCSMPGAMRGDRRATDRSVDRAALGVAGRLRRDGRDGVRVARRRGSRSIGSLTSSHAFRAQNSITSGAMASASSGARAVAKSLFPSRDVGLHRRQGDDRSRSGCSTCSGFRNSSTPSGVCGSRASRRRSSRSTCWPTLDRSPAAGCRAPSLREAGA